MKNEYIKHNDATMSDYIDITLYRRDIITLHNLCVDVLKEYPDPFHIQRIKDKLEMILNETSNIQEQDDWTF